MVPSDLVPVPWYVVENQESYHICCNLHTGTNHSHLDNNTICKLSMTLLDNTLLRFLSLQLIDTLSHGIIFRYSHWLFIKVVWYSYIQSGWLKGRKSHKMIELTVDSPVVDLETVLQILIDSDSTTTPATVNHVGGDNKRRSERRRHKSKSSNTGIEHDKAAPADADNGDEKSRSERNRHKSKSSHTSILHDNIAPANAEIEERHDESAKEKKARRQRRRGRMKKSTETNVDVNVESSSKTESLWDSVFCRSCTRL